MRFRRRPAARQPAESPRHQVYSYYGNLAPSKGVTTGRGSESKPHKSWPLWPGLLAALVIVCGVGYLLYLSPTPKVVIIGPQNQPLLRQPADYQKIATQLLHKSLSNRTKVTINTPQLEQSLRHDFPELDMLHISLPITGSRPVITIHPSSPALVFTSNLTTVGLDVNGKVLVNASRLSQSMKDSIPSVTDQSGIPLSLDKPVLSHESIAFIRSIYDQLHSKQIGIQSMVLPSTANQLQVHLADRPYYVKFNFLTDARQQVGSFLAVKQKLETDRVTPKEYIDVRVEERAYYK